MGGNPTALDSKVAKVSMECQSGRLQMESGPQGAGLPGFGDGKVVYRLSLVHGGGEGIEVGFAKGGVGIAEGTAREDHGAFSLLGSGVPARCIIR